MSRLITFGCSLTFGHGLPDCFVPPKDPGSQPSKLGWPSIIAKCIDRDCVNISSPGASNKKIWYDIINFNYQKDDIVFILWSYIERSTIIHNNNKMTFVGTWVPDHKNYYKELYDQNDATIMSSLFVNHANMYLRQENITTYNMIPGTRELPILELNNLITKHIPIYLTDLRDYYPLALDKRHPGTEFQIAYAKKILDFLNIKNNLPEIKELNFFNKIKRQFIEMTRGD